MIEIIVISVRVFDVFKRINNLECCIVRSVVIKNVLLLILEIKMRVNVVLNLDLVMVVIKVVGLFLESVKVMLINVFNLINVDIFVIVCKVVFCFLLGDCLRGRLFLVVFCLLFF